MLVRIIVLMVLEVARASQEGTSQLHDGNTNTTDISVPTSSPSLTSDCTGDPCHGSVSDDKLLLVLNQLENLKWNHTIVFYDQDYTDNDLQLLLPVLQLATVFYLSGIHRRFDVKQLLQKLHEKFFPTLNFLLLSNYSRALELLQIVDLFDLESNRTTEFRHHSHWVVSCYSPITRFLPHIYHLENVILIVSDKNGCSNLHRLVTTSGRRTFSCESSIEELNNDVFPNTRHGLNNRTLVVSTMVYEPFVMKKGNAFEGYYIDILDAIASILNFSYEIIQPADRSWGEIVDGRWDGLIGQLERREVDLIVAPLTIHEDREKVMDFLYPPIYTWIDDIMYKLHTDETESWPFYLEPFSSLVFLILAITLVVSTQMGYILCRWDDAHTGTGRKQGTHKPWLCIFSDTFFYMFGILIARGLETNRENQSTRLLIFTWGLFSVIIAACYSANLVASFAEQKPKLPFTSLGELVRQKEYKWGFRSGAIREHIFKRSRSGDMKMAWEGVLKFNKTDPEVLSQDYSVHIAKVKAEEYATIIHRYTIEKLRRNDCGIRYVGQDISWRQLSIGVPSDYPLRKDLEEILSAIVDSGLLDKWWRQWSKLTADPCIEDRKVDTLSLPDVASIFCILCGGLSVSGVVLVTEFVMDKWFQINTQLLCS